MMILSTILFNIPLNGNNIRALNAVMMGVLVWISYFILSTRIAVVFHK
ncbi:DUF2569 family protein [Yersinia aldovae]|nr:hypothetical protein yaldo0001_19920 [Yersinia aldovae ATCC 35236]